MKGNLFIISAPSGTGKTTILKPIIADTPRISFSVSHTTRTPRTGETNGQDYFFVDKEEFMDIRKKNGFLEWAEVHGNFYGTSRQAVIDRLNQGDDIILDIDVQGASQIRKDPELNGTFIFIVPPSWQELEKRLSGRNTDSPETIKLRLANAKKEMKDIDLYDYVVINDDLPKAIDLIKAILIEKRIKNRRDAQGEALVLPELN